MDLQAEILTEKLLTEEFLSEQIVNNIALKKAHNKRYDIVVANSSKFDPMLRDIILSKHSSQEQYHAGKADAFGEILRLLHAKSIDYVLGKYEKQIENKIKNEVKWMSMSPTD